MDEKESLLNSYFAELDPEVRMELLEQYGKANPQDANNDLYQKLWTLRYENPKKANQRVDKFLWQIINLIGLYRVSRFFSMGTEKEIDSAMKELGFSDAAVYGDAGREVLYLEFRNAARRYLSTCEHKGYGKKLMGIVSMNEKERRNKAAGEIWQLTHGLTERFKTGDDMALFCKAVLDEFIDQCPDGENHIKKQDERHRNKRIA